VVIRRQEKANRLNRGLQDYSRPIISRLQQFFILDLQTRTGGHS